MIYATTALALGFLAGHGVLTPQQNAPTVVMGTVSAKRPNAPPTDRSGLGLAFVHALAREAGCGRKPRV